MMDRRRFLLTALVGVPAAPLAVEAQPAGKVYRIGILANVPLADAEGARLWGAFIQGLRELGYVEGKNITIEWRFSGGRYERLPEPLPECLDVRVAQTRRCYDADPRDLPRLRLDRKRRSEENG
ncbi:MAG TPA: hypothetical protein VFU03_03465, partial [Gemmatimonadales bacterium]|nr:hypothetical protein [Gemmatimonadales bacterium]